MLKDSCMWVMAKQLQWRQQKPLDCLLKLVIFGFRRDICSAIIQTKFNSISTLGKFSFCRSFENNKVSLFQDLNITITSFLIDNLYLLDTILSYNETLQTTTRGTKCKLMMGILPYFGLNVQDISPNSEMRELCVTKILIS